MHKASVENEKGVIFNLAVPFNIIIKDIKNQSSKQIINKIDNIHVFPDDNNNLFTKKNTLNSNKINLYYYKKTKNHPWENEYINNIFGSKFVGNNMNNIKLIINGEQCKLMKKYDLKEGINHIQMITINPLKKLEYMFELCSSLIDIEELKYLNTQKVTNFSFMFCGCSSLSELKGLENWDVSKGKNFSHMFDGCSSLLDLKGLEKWDVSNGKDFSYMFSKCSKIGDIKAIENWNISKGSNCSNMFYQCSSLSDITIPYSK